MHHWQRCINSVRSTVCGSNVAVSAATADERATCAKTKPASALVIQARLCAIGATKLAARSGRHCAVRSTYRFGVTASIMRVSIVTVELVDDGIQRRICGAYFIASNASSGNATDSSDILAVHVALIGAFIRSHIAIVGIPVVLTSAIPTIHTIEQHARFSVCTHRLLASCTTVAIGTVINVFTIAIANTTALDIRHQREQQTKRLVARGVDDSAGSATQATAGAS
jgi:hypothetical protein